MSFEAESPLEGEEPSIIDYARLHGLSCDPADDGIDDFDFSLLEATSPSYNDDDMEQRVGMAIDGKFHDERLNLNADARAMLASVFDTQQAVELYPMELDIRRTKYVRLEEPLLLRDHELDIKQYLADRLAAQSDSDIDLSKLPFFPVNDENDEGLLWPEKYQSLPDEYNEILHEEKIQVPKEALVLLHQVCERERRPEDIHAIMESQLKYKRSKALETLTPPLSPYLSVTNPPESSSPLPRLDSLTTWSNTSETRKDEDDVIHVLAKEDEDVLGGTKSLFADVDKPIMTDDLAQIYSPLQRQYSKELLSSSSPLERVHRLKLVPPLSPFSEARPPSSDGLKLDKMPLWELVNSQPLDEETKNTFETYIEPAALQIHKTLLNERLVDPRITERLPVPVLDLDTKVAPSDVQLSDEDEEDELRMIKLPIANAMLHHWSTSKLENQLRWTPFPTSQQPNLDEDVRDSGLLESFLKLDIDKCVKPETLTWKPDGLRILDESDEEDLLPEAEPEQELGQQSLGPPAGIDELLKRVEDITATSDKQRSPALRSTPVQSSNQPKLFSDPTLDFSTLLTSKQHTFSDPLTRSPRNARALLPDSSSIERFMGLQGQQVKRRKLEHTPATVRGPVSAAITSHTDPVASPGKAIDHMLPDLPVIPAHLPPCQIIASQSFTANIQLFRHLTKLYPNLDITERNSLFAQRITQDCTHSNPSPHSQHTEDADLTLSLSTGILITNIARLHQLPLPGSVSSQSASVPGHSVRNRIATVSAYYSHLVVIVGCTAVSAERLSQQDRQALGLLQSYAARFREPGNGGFGTTDVEIVLATGAVMGLAYHIVNVLANRKHQGPQLRLLSEESDWEARLRRAGMNAWAAQTVLSCLDVEDGAGHHQVSKALAATVKEQTHGVTKAFCEAVGDQEMARRVLSVLNSMLL